MTRLLLATLAACLLAGCGQEAPRSSPRAKEPAPSTGPVAEGKKVRVGQNVWTEFLPGNKRRVLVSAEVCLREGMLELLLTRKGKKEHEAILAVEADARKIHEALLLAGAKPGTPTAYFPKFKLPTGQLIDIAVRWTENGRERQMQATDWVRSVKARQAMPGRWVFAGSMLYKASDEPDAPMRYGANEGDVIAISNFDTAMLDVPYKSSKDVAELGFEAWTDRIPPVGTKVALVLTPMADN